LLLFRDGPAAHLAQGVRRERLHAEGDGAEPRPPHGREQILVEAVQAGLALPAQIQLPGPDLLAQGEDALALLAEEGVAEDHEGLRMVLAELLQLFAQVLDRARPIAPEDPMRAVGAELRAAPAGQERERALGPGEEAGP